MSGVTKVNPSPEIAGFEQIGKKITWMKILVTNIPVYADPATDADPILEGYQTDGPLQTILNVVQMTGVIIASGPVITGSKLSIGIEGIFTGADNFDGTTGEGDLAKMQTAIRALGTSVGAGPWVSADGTTGDYAGLDLSGVTVTQVELDLV